MKKYLFGIFVGAFVFIGIAVLNVPFASAAFKPTCAITSDPTTVSEKGATVMLYYEVLDDPTRIEISSIPSGSAPTGTPRVGAPDSGRVDHRSAGSIVSGAISAETTFTMTVTNGRGSGTCTTKVYYNPRPSTGWQVPLVQKTPVFTRFDIPGGFGQDNTDYTPFYTSYWIPGGYFVVNGYGTSAACLGGSPLCPLKNIFESGGMYIFNENGSFVGARDVLFDTSSRAPRCFESGGCADGFFIHPVGSGKFVRDMQNWSVGYTRGPVLYSVGSGSISMGQRLFFNERGGGNQSESGDPVSRLSSFTHVAVAGGKMIGTAERHDGGGRSHEQTEIYDMNFNVLAKSASVLFSPIFGISDFIITSPGVGYFGAFAPINLYKMPSLDELSRGTLPVKVKTLWNDRNVIAYAIDSANSNRVAIFTIPKGSNNDTAPTMTLFDASAGSFKQMSERKIGTGNQFGRLIAGQRFALSGDYLVYTKCPRDPSGDMWLPKWDGSRGGQRANGCELIVEKTSDGKKLSVEPLPISKYSDFGLDGGLGALIGEAQAILSLAISPSGKILVATGVVDGGDNGNIYMYQIGGVSAPPVSIPPPGSSGQGAPLYDLKYGNCTLKMTTGDVQFNSPITSAFFNCMLNSALQGFATSKR